MQFGLISLMKPVNVDEFTDVSVHLASFLGSAWVHTNKDDWKEQLVQANIEVSMTTEPEEKDIDGNICWAYCTW